MPDTVYKRLDYNEVVFLCNALFAKLKASPLNTQYEIVLNSGSSAYVLNAIDSNGNRTLVSTVAAASDSAAGLLSAALHIKLGGIAAGAQVNTIEGIKVNSVAQTPDGNKAVDITVPVKVSDLTNDSGFQTASQVAASIAAAITTTYKPGGSVAFASLPALNADHLGFVYNVTDAFTTTANFVEGAGKSFPAGTDVAIVDVGAAQNPSYKYNVMGGFVDLSGYVQASQMATMTNQEITTAVNTAYTDVFGS